MSDFKVFYVVDGVSLNDAAGRWFLEASSRRRSLPSVRATRVSTPGRNGSAFVPNDTFDDGRFVLSIIVTDKDSNGVKGGAVQAERNVEHLTALLAGTGRLVLVEYHTGPMEKRTAYGRVAAGSEPEPRGPLLDRYLVRFVVEIPAVFWSDGAGPQLVEGAAPSASGALPLLALSGGSAPVTDAVIRFAGPFNGRCSVRDVGGGAAYKWTGTPDASTSTMTTAAGTITNLWINPDLVGNGVRVEVRRNLITSPVIETSLTGWGLRSGVASDGGAVSGQGRVINIEPVTGNSYLVTAPGTISTPVVGDSYSMTMTLRNDGDAPIELRISFWLAGPSTYAPSDSVTIPPGESRALSLHNYVVEDGVTQLSPRIVASPSGISAAAKITLFNWWTLEKSTFVGPQFNGGGQVGDNDPDFRYEWVGPINNSESIITGEQVRGFSQGATAAIIVSSLGGKPAARQISLGTNMFNQSIAGAVEIPDAGTFMATAHILKDFPSAAQYPYIRTQPPAVDAIGPSSKVGAYPLRSFYESDGLASSRRVQLRVRPATPGIEVYWTDVGLFEGTYLGDTFSGSTPSTVGTSPTGLDYEGTVAAGSYVFLNAATLKAHTSSSPDAWDSGTDVSGNLDYPPAGPLQITPAAQADGTHYAVAYTLPAAKNVADAAAIRAERKFI